MKKIQDKEFNLPKDWDAKLFNEWSKNTMARFCQFKQKKVMKIQILILAAILFFGCSKDNKEPNGFDVVYQVGSHDPIKDTDYSRYDYVFEFTGKSIYQVSAEDQADWNKLFGKKYIGDYSIRWVWSYDPYINKFLIGWYVHDGTSQPKYEEVVRIGIGQRIRLKIDDSGYSNYYLYYQIEGQPMYLIQPQKNHNRIFLYTHNGYFGGNATANCSYRVYNNF